MEFRCEYDSKRTIDWLSQQSYFQDVLAHQVVPVRYRVGLRPTVDLHSLIVDQGPV